VILLLGFVLRQSRLISSMFELPTSGVTELVDEEYDFEEAISPT
jgi:hypothetical protein